MIEKITVMNRREAVALTRRRHMSEKMAMISIGSTNKDYTSRPISCTHVPLIWTVTFDDVLTEYDSEVPMKANQAKDIADFIRRVEEKGFTHIIIHCDEGISRSTAVAKAIAESRNIPETAINYKRQPYPNPRVYALMKAVL